MELLTRAQERKLSRTARGRRELVERNKGLVLMCLGRMRVKDLALQDDLYQEGQLGLIRAAEKFDPGRGTKFSTYAVAWVRSMMSRYLRQNRLGVHVPEVAYFRHPEAREVRCVSIDRVDDRPRRRGNFDGLFPYDPPDRAHPYDAPPGLRADLESAMGRLTERERLVVRARYLEIPRLTLEDLGRALGVSRERVRQIEVKALEGMRRDLC